MKQMIPQHRVVHFRYLRWQPLMQKSLHTGAVLIITEKVKIMILTMDTENGQIGITGIVTVLMDILQPDSILKYSDLLMQRIII